jgi:hypothetical protein
MGFERNRIYRQLTSSFTVSGLPIIQESDFLPSPGWGAVPGSLDLGWTLGHKTAALRYL